MESLGKNLELETERAALELLEPMRSVRPVICDVADMQRRRERFLVAMREQVANVPQTRRREHQRNVLVASVGAGLALAAGVVLWVNLEKTKPALLTVAQGQSTVGTVATVKGDVRRTLQGQTRQAFVGAALAPTEAIHTGTDSHARMHTPRGVGLDLAGDSDLEFLGQTLQGEQIRLVKGSVQAKVPKLGAAASFSVVTPEATVTVHGTQFTVDVVDSKSCVRVSEGLVAVHSAAAETAWLRAGDSWGCDRKPAMQGVTPPEAVRAPAARAQRTPTPVGQTSTLIAENRLFEEALRAQREGRDEEAERLFRMFLSQYPKAALAGQAREQLRRLALK